DFVSTLLIDPSNQETWVHSAIVALGSGNPDEYRRQCREMLSRFGTSTNRVACEQVVRTCLVLPDAVADLGLVMELADRAVAPGDADSGDQLEWRALAKGTAEYRAGHFDAAAQWLAKGTTINADIPGTAVKNFFLAMAEVKRGRQAEAQPALKRALEI